MDELKHFGVLGMKWGHRRALSTINSMANKYRRSANNMRDRADIAGAYAYLRTDSQGQVHGSDYKKMRVDQANARAERLRTKANQSDNIAKGIEKARKLIDGMDMKQSIATIQKAAGYSRGAKAYSMLMGKGDRLSVALVDYAKKTTNFGMRSVK